MQSGLNEQYPYDKLVIATGASSIIPVSYTHLVEAPAPAGSRMGGGRAGGTEPVNIGFDEYETLRLMDYERFSQKQCAERMQVSRATVARMYENARRKVAEALVKGKGIVIAGGDVSVCRAPRPECRDALHCCHREEK